MGYTEEQESSLCIPEQATPEEEAYIEGLEDAARAIETAIDMLEDEEWKTPLYETVLNSVRLAEARILLRRIRELIDEQTAELIMKYSAAGGQAEGQECCYDAVSSQAARPEAETIIDEPEENGGAV